VETGTTEPEGEATLMGLGGCIILIAVGAILTFATDWHMQGVNLDVVGLILMAVGIIGVATFTNVARRRRVMVPPTTVVEERHHHRDEYGNGYGA
jgi:hypothetical protein